MDQIGGRKFFYALLITVMAFIIVVTKVCTPQEFFGFIIVIAGMYIGGNLGDQFIASKTPQENKEVPPQG